MTETTPTTHETSNHEEKADMANTTTTAPGAATVTLRMSKSEAIRFLRDCIGDSDSLPEPDLELKAEIDKDDEDFSFALITLLCGKHLIEGSGIISAAAFYRQTPIGPVLVLFEEHMVQIIAQRPSEGIYRTVRWMFEGDNVLGEAA